MSLPVALSKSVKTVTVSLPAAQSKITKPSQCQSLPVGGVKERQAVNVTLPVAPVAQSNITKPSQCFCQWHGSRISPSRHSVFASGAVKYHQAASVLSQQTPSKRQSFVVITEKPREREREREREEREREEREREREENK